MPSDFMPPAQSIDETLARIDAQTQAAVDAVERARGFADTLTRIRGRGSVAGVSVEVDHVGITVAISYADPAPRMSPEALAGATMSALRAALADVLGQVTERTQATWGSDPVADRIVAEVAERFAVVSR